MLRKNLLRKLFAVRLAEEIDSILGVVKHGFDVAIRSAHPDLVSIVDDILMEEINNHPTPFAVVHSMQEMFDIESRVDDCEIRELPVIMINNEPLPTGAGFLFFDLPTPETLLPSLSNVVSIILEYFKQNNHVLSFDAPTMAILREILKRHGILTVIDAVVQVAFHSGFTGDSDVSRKTLEYILEFSDINQGEGSYKKDGYAQKGAQNSKSNLNSRPAEEFFRQLLTTKAQPHIFVKAALSFFVVNNLGKSVVEGSKLLDISRTTLNQHLSLAQEYGMSDYFSKH